ncbi:MAG TPA: alkaline phosphatase family protein [Kofleriaceae bacterium]
MADEKVVRDHRGENGPTYVKGPPPSLDGAIVRDHRTGSSSGIKHIFVLMMENRSFDHMLGFSNIKGTDALTGKPTQINGLAGTESNTLQNGAKVTVSTGAPDRMNTGPGHNFPNVRNQLCGVDVPYVAGTIYPQITCGGYGDDYALAAGSLAAPNWAAAGDALQGWAPGALPILTQLAQEFCVCDNWFSSMPGPTEPNRMFVHAGTSAEWDKSPTTDRNIASQLPTGGHDFPNGTIFKKVKAAHLKYRIYADDGHPNVSTLADMTEFLDYDDFASDLMDPAYDAHYTFIEPSYDALSGTFSNGNSQHPRGSVAAGERFIEATYEAIRKSPLWPNSMFVVTYDEHGGFYDHVKPPHVQPDGYRGGAYGFTFAQLGPRVPAVVISPLIPRNMIDHTLYDHTAIPATVERQFGFAGMARDKTMSDFRHLVTLTTARTDCPTSFRSHDHRTQAARTSKLPATVPDPDVPLSEEDGPVIAMFHSAIVQDYKANPSAQAAVEARAAQVKTRGDLLAYLKEVEARVAPRRAAARAAMKAGASVK